MYLYDRVAQSVAAPAVRDPSGRIHRIPGAAEVAAAVRTCGARYVLDTTIRDICLELLCNRAEVIQPEDDCYRIPHQTMWIEWTDPQVRTESGMATQRAGMLIQADESGRRGTMRSYSDDGIGDPWASQIHYEFDFDAPISSEQSLCGLSFDDVRDPETVKRIYRHGMPQLDRRWLDYFHASGGLTPDILRQMMRASLGDFGLLCSFLLLLSLDCAATEPRQGLEKINRARQRSGKALLLDHVEVSLRLAAVGGGQGSGARGDRSAARLHQVRGHLVRRAGKTFWRTHHLRGDVGKGVVASRTVRVTGNGDALRQGLG